MATPFQFRTEEEAKRVLQSEGKRLEEIAKEVWREYKASYTPEVYVRTDRAENSIKLKKRIRRINNNTWGIEVTFKDDLAYHDSVINKGKYKKGHAVMLISSGWAVKRGKHRDIPRFGHYGGFDYIGKVMKRFNDGKHEGITLELQWSGKYLK